MFSGGAQSTTYGATVSGTQVLSGGFEFVGSESSVAAVTISGGARVEFDSEVEVASGARGYDGVETGAKTISGVAIQSGAFVDYSSIDVASGGELELGTGARAGSVYVESGGLAYGVGALVDVSEIYGTLDRAQVDGGVDVYGVTSAVTVSGGYETLESGAIDSNGVLEQGATQSVFAGGSALGTTVASGGDQIVSSGGYASGTRVLAGGVETLIPGAKVSGVTISKGGELVADEVVSGGQTLVVPASPATATTAFDGVSLLAGSILTLGSATVSSGGVLSMAAGSLAAAIVVSGGATVTGTGSVDGYLLVSSGGMAKGVGVLSGAIDDLYAGGVESGVTVASGATLDLLQGSLAGALTIGKLAATTTVSGASVQAGATVAVTGYTVASGGGLTVASGGQATDLSVLAGGRVVDNGEIVEISPGPFTWAGTLSGSGILAEGNGGVLALSGAQTAFTGTLQIMDGVVELATASGIGKATIQFAADYTSATLQIDAADTPANGGTYADPLQDFDSALDAVDLRGVAFTAGATATLKNSVLTLVDGSETLHFDLVGEAASAFTVGSDGHGGTTVGPSPAGAQAAVLLQATAAFKSDGAAALLTTTSPGPSSVFSPNPALGQAIGSWSTR